MKGWLLILCLLLVAYFVRYSYFPAPAPYLVSRVNRWSGSVEINVGGEWKDSTFKPVGPTELQVINLVAFLSLGVAGALGWVWIKMRHPDPQPPLDKPPPPKRRLP